MRPEELYPLFAELASLPGVGKTMEKSLSRLLARPAEAQEEIPPRIRELLFHLPVGLLDRTYSPPLSMVESGRVISVRVKVTAHRPPPPRSRAPYRILCENRTGTLLVVYFRGDPGWMQKKFPVGSEVALSGRAEIYDGQAQMAHPDMVLAGDQLGSLLRMEPVYPLSAGLTSRRLGQWAAQVLQKIPVLPEWHDGGWVAAQGFPAWKAALFAAHHPAGLADMEPSSPARARLAADEALADQLTRALVRQRLKTIPGHAIDSLTDGMAANLLRALPFTLTEGQKEALVHIRADMAGGERMLRLLQGDVGSGKTVVALLAMLDAADAGFSAALMAPTELLARQHYRSFCTLLEGSGVEVGLITGSMKAAERRQMEQRIADGEIRLVIGTHALFMGQAGLPELALAVIDEQHRFGVAQRMALAEKGNRPHILLMSATPIPRSLMLALHGDLDVSTLREKPAGRQEITTSVLPLTRLDEVVAAVERAVGSGAKVYWLCPQVEESADGGTAQATEERHAMLQTLFGERVGMAHGRMKAAERDRAMQGFAGDTYDILVATTVIEVGMDVPGATVMVIENAERFGLAQLHQLRGRVGRSDRPSYCLLLYHPDCTENAIARLKIIRNQPDGFAIAEEDLRLRGGGDQFGTRQSGLPDYRFINLYHHREIVAAMRDEAHRMLERDPHLVSPRGQALRILLYLFGYEHSLRWLERA